jgi:hypothetical protein
MLRKRSVFLKRLLLRHPPADHQVVPRRRELRKRIVSNYLGL